MIGTNAGTFLEAAWKQYDRITKSKVLIVLSRRSLKCVCGLHNLVRWGYEFESNYEHVIEWDMWMIMLMESFRNS